MQTTPSHGPVMPRRKCGAMEALHRLLEDYPDFRLALGNLEHLTRARLAQALIMPTEPVIIPVVVHVVYRTPDERISPAQVASQIDAVNRDYRFNNADQANIPRVWSGLEADSYPVRLSEEGSVGRRHFGESLARRHKRHRSLPTIA